MTFATPAFPQLARNFPDYPLASLPDIPPEWEDASLHQAPKFDTGRGLMVWIDHPEAAQRLNPEARFQIDAIMPDGSLGDEDALFDTDDWSAVLRFVEEHGARR